MKKIFLGFIALLLVAPSVYSQEPFIQKHLSLANEYPLENLSKIYDECYRFMISDGGWRSSTIINAYKSEDKYFVVFKKVDSYYVGKDDSKVFKVGEIKSISRKDWDSIIALVDQSSFWTMSENEQKIGSDGSFWILQGSKDKLSHQVIRWAPDKGPYRKLCLVIWRLSGDFMGYWQDKME